MVDFWYEEVIHRWKFLLSKCFICRSKLPQMTCIAPSCVRPKSQAMLDPNDLEICHPIDNIDMVLEWEPPKVSWASKVVPKVKRTKFVYKGHTKCEEHGVPNLPLHRRQAPKTLFCHDMRGGYLDDRFVEGCDDNSAFNFFRWSGIDIFVYFSHKFLTIPPVTWINAAHRNGVTILGTIITEGTEGEALCKDLLCDREKVLRLCDKLVMICQHYGFSGYLLNIENEIQMQHMKNLLFFVEELKSQLKRVGQDSLLLWYDSVDESTGKLNWQNKLNEKNRSFFNRCDGIFLNYAWDDECLQLSLKNSGERYLDVFVGIDVFGRGCLGGGGFNCQEALSMIRHYNLSAAIFAPGWVHEAQEEDEHSFLKRDYMFWANLFQYLFISGPAQMPFETSFCVGAGLNLYHKGKVVKKGLWHNLGKQDFQACDLLGWADFEEHSCISYFENEAYNGGTCLILKKPSPSEKHHEHRLFVCEFRTTEYDYLILKATMKLLEECTGNFELYIKTQSEEGIESQIYLKPDKDSYHKLSHKRWVSRIFSTDPGIGTVVEVGYRMTKLSSILLGRIVIIKEPLTL